MRPALAPQPSAADLLAIVRTLPDVVFRCVKDVARVEREAREARAWGYRGKMLIHPAQVAPVHEAFRPTPAEAEWARKVLAAVESAHVGHGGVVLVDGRMVDVPVIEQARRVAAELE